MIIPVDRGRSKSTARRFAGVVYDDNGKYEKKYKNYPEIKLQSIKNVIFIVGAGNMIMTPYGYADLTCPDAQKALWQALQKNFDKGSFIILNTYGKFWTIDYEDFCTAKIFALVKSQAEKLHYKFGRHETAGTYIIFQKQADKVLCEITNMLGNIVKDEK